MNKPNDIILLDYEIDKDGNIYVTPNSNNASQRNYGSGGGSGGGPGGGGPGGGGSQDDAGCGCAVIAAVATLALCSYWGFEFGIAVFLAAVAAVIAFNSAKG